MNHPKLTAYALDQLSAFEHAAVEADFKSDEALLAIRETAELARLLREHRAAELLPEPSADLFRALQSRLAGELIEPEPVKIRVEPAEPPRPSYFRRVLLPVALAASVLVNVAALSYLVSGQGERVKVVHDQSAPQEAQGYGWKIEPPLEMLPSSVPTVAQHNSFASPQPTLTLSSGVVSGLAEDEVLSIVEEEFTAPSLPMGHFGSAAPRDSRAEPGELNVFSSTGASMANDIPRGSFGDAAQQAAPYVPQRATQQFGARSLRAYGGSSSRDRRSLSPQSTLPQRPKGVVTNEAGDTKLKYGMPTLEPVLDGTLPPDSAYAAFAQPAVQISSGPSISGSFSLSTSPVPPIKQIVGVTPPLEKRYRDGLGVRPLAVVGSTVDSDEDYDIAGTQNMALAGTMLGLATSPRSQTAGASIVNDVTVIGSGGVGKLSMLDPVNGPWDIDNDHDGQKDSLWVDLGLPVQTDGLGRQTMPLAGMMVQDLDGRLNMNTRGNNTHYRQGYDTWSDSYESGASGSPSTVAAGGSALAPGFRTPARVNINTYLGGTISAATLSGNNTMPADGYRSYPVADLVIPISPASSSAQFASPRVGTGRGFSVDALDLNGRSLDIPGNNLTFTVVRPQTSIANSGFASSTPAQPSNPVGLQTQTGGYLGGVTLPGPSSSTRINAGVTHPQNPVAGFPAGQFPTFTNDHNVPFTQNSFSQTSPTTSSLIGQNEAAPSSSRAAPAPASLADTFSSDGVEPTKQNQRSFGWAVENSPGQKGILDQQLYPLMVEEQLLIESFGADHPKAKVVRKQIQVLQDMVSQHPELLAANDPRPELYRSLIEYQAVVDQFGPHDPRLNVARAKVNAMQRIIREQQESPNTEAYDAIVENPFYKPLETPLSTFSIDVDTASYSNMRRFITQGQLPPRGAVRLEELINYFTYDYPQPKGDVPFSVTTEVAACPWNAAHRLVRVGLKGREIVAEDRPASNIVFLLDVSGSMSDYNKLPLVKQGMRMLTEQLTERDRVAIVVYAGASGMVLPSTTGDHKAKIIGALDQLQAGGSTNGASGLQLAYNVASENMIKGGINRVILCTDGDFNVGVTSQDQLVSMIEEKAKTGVQLSVLGFGMGNYKDSTLEKLADKGDGNYAYIDTEREARKVLVDQLSSTLIVIAKDVKIQIEFNPARVASYRLLGYENRVMAAEDFNNDKKDAGEIGAGHTVTALYEVVPGGVQDEPPSVDPLKYQRRGQVAAGDDASNELLTLKLRYKLPGEDKSKLIETPVKDDGKSYAAASKDFKFSAAVASFGMLLRCSQYMGATNFDAVLELAREGRGNDLSGYRDEFIDLVRRTKELVK